MKKTYILALALAALLIVPVALAASDYFLKIDGTKQGLFNNGSSIVVKTFNYDVHSPRDAASGLPTGKRQHKPLTITKEWDASSPQLFNALVNNENLKEVTLNVTSTTGRGRSSDVFSIKLTNANVVDFHLTGDDKGPMEEVSFTFQKIEFKVNGKTMAMDDWEAPIV